MQTPKEFVSANRDKMLRDIKRLVDINSIKGEPELHAPYGMGVRRTEMEAMKIAAELGFSKVRDCEGYIAYAHMGDEEKFLGVIAHADVVPVGDGWFSDPFCMIEKEGYLVGRGVSDDKGPLIAGLYACKYLMENNIPLKYGVRVLIGCDEECGMSDVEYYLSKYPAPVFTFSPDAGFPVCHGEKGIYSSDLVSPAIENGKIKYIFGGLASNVVPDVCTVKLAGVDAAAVKAAAEGKDCYTVAEEDGMVVVTAAGKASHAGSPWNAVNANLLALQLLLDANVLEGSELAAVKFMCAVMLDMSGSFLGIAAEDGKFEKNSIIGGMIRLREDGRIVLNTNSRYNTAIAPADIEANIEQKAAQFGFTVENVSNSGPVYLAPDSPAVKLMTDIYNDVTGDNAKPYTMSGGTYARKLPNAVAFGIGMGADEAEEDAPDWVGSAHMKNEAVKIDTIMKATEIYIQSLIKLQEVEF
ncbi:MAG: Sapep family Mn(2+)-dependent dipeptidase [Oscillospiraceae bacterium]|nr:Sapep family Mn(2+)-dependent dipeptidase [Oscillospiraceae bacterium]